MKKLLTFALLTSAPAFAAEGPVMSPAASRTTFSSDADLLVERSYPKFDAQSVSHRLEAAARALSARQDRVTVRSLRGIERALGLPQSTLPPTAADADTPSAFYRVNPALGLAGGLVKDQTYMGMTREAFAAIEQRVQTQHAAFAQSLGLPADEMMRVSFHKLMAQSLLADSPNASDGTPAVVRKGITHIHRGFGGFPVDGAKLAIGSFDMKRVQDFKLSWPKFAAHPGITSYALDAEGNIKKAIVDKVRGAALGRGEVAVSMGLVFRPGKLAGGGLGYAPAMKVFVIPKAKVQRTDAGEGQVTEAGAVFYVDVLKAAPPIADGNTTDL